MPREWGSIQPPLQLDDDMHHFPTTHKAPPTIVRGRQFIAPPSTYQPPWTRFQPVVLAYPAPLYGSISGLSMSILLAMDPAVAEQDRPVAPRTLQVIQ